MRFKCVRRYDIHLLIKSKTQLKSTFDLIDQCIYIATLKKMFEVSILNKTISLKKRNNKSRHTENFIAV